jgi:hypothetical protein
VVSENHEQGISPEPPRPGRLRRVAYSALTLSVIGGAVAVLGAPVKWS